MSDDDPLIHRDSEGRIYTVNPRTGRWREVRQPPRGGMPSFGDLILWGLLVFFAVQFFLSR